MQTYKEQYKHPLWQKRRLEVMSANGFECQSCGSTEITLNVHHRHYVQNRKVWEYNNDELKCLCDECHKRTHNRQRRLLDMLVDEALIDFAIGYILGQRCINYDDLGSSYVELDSWEQIAGFADSAKYDWEDIAAIIKEGVLNINDLPPR